MKTVRLSVRITLPWWARGYVNFCQIFADIHGTEIDADKVGEFIARHAKKEVIAE